MEIEAAKENKKTDLKDSEKIKKFEIPEFYSVGIELDKALANPGCDADIVLREGDKIIVPQYNGTVKINGAVMYPNTVGFRRARRLNIILTRPADSAKRQRRARHTLFT